ncbi:FAM92 protein-domain-containing protein [Chytridium lagenaria]|nr:FAM92 protein-domain-containing protein [Chytridium lagenaria]
MNLLPTPRGADRKTQAILSLVRETDKNVGNVRAVLDGYLRNHERLRQKSIKMSLVLKSFSDASSPEMIRMLDAFAGMLTEREKERERMIERIHYVSGYPLKSYTAICQKLRDEVKSREVAIDREHKKQQQLDKIMIKESNNRPKISQVQMELITATHDVSEATEHLMESVRKFEDQKRLDMKASLSELIWSEISYHARSLEILSKYHQILGDIDFENDGNYVDDYVEGGSGERLGQRPGEPGYRGRSPSTSPGSIRSVGGSIASTPLSTMSPMSPETPMTPSSPWMRKGR